MFRKKNLKKMLLYMYLKRIKMCRCTDQVLCRVRYIVFLCKAKLFFDSVGKLMHHLFIPANSTFVCLQVHNRRKKNKYESDHCNFC